MRVTLIEAAPDVYHPRRVSGTSLESNTTDVSTNNLVPYFKAHQNPQMDQPTSFVSVDEARAFKKKRTHYFATHNVKGYDGVKAIVELPNVALPAVVKSEREEREFSGWAVVGQTVRPAVKCNKLSRGPGFPHWALVQ